MKTFVLEDGSAIPLPTPGRIVHYQLRPEDVRRINDAATAPGSRAVVNPHRAGDVLPAIVVRVWPGHRANLQVFLDGEIGTLWVTSREPGDEPGEWTWPTVKR